MAQFRSMARRLAAPRGLKVKRVGPAGIVLAWKAPRGAKPAGYLISTAQDMSRYLAMYLNNGVTANGDRIVSRRGLATMLAPGRPGSWARGQITPTRATPWAGSSAGPGRSPLNSIRVGRPTPAP